MTIEFDKTWFGIAKSNKFQPLFPDGENLFDFAPIEGMDKAKAQLIPRLDRNGVSNSPAASQGKTKKAGAGWNGPNEYPDKTNQALAVSPRKATNNFCYRSATGGHFANAGTLTPFSLK